MIHGATPTLIFKINNDIDFTAIEDIWVSIYPFGQNGGMLTKNMKSLSIDNENKVIAVELSQEETLQMPEQIEIQVKVLFINGKVLVSDVFRKDCGRLLNWNQMGYIAPETSI